MIYHTADHHFGHKNIIKYCDRPFTSVDQMNSFMIDEWNKDATDEDIIIHHGDFCFKYTKEETKELLSSLKGKKFLIMGNHDKRGTKRQSELFWEDVGFDRVFRDSIVMDKKFYLTHRPSYEKGLITIHGHTHDKLASAFELEYFVSVCVEKNEYRMVPHDIIMTMLKRQRFEIRSSLERRR